jgi:hypothetical protein
MKTVTSFYLDTLIVAEFSKPTFTKNAENFASSLINAAKSYFESKIDQNDKTGSVLNLLAPGVISVTLSALGLGKIGTLLGLAASVFHIDVKSIFSSIYEKIKEAVSNGPTTSENVHNIVVSTIQQNTSPATEQEANDFFNKQSFDKTLREIHLLKLAANTKNAGLFDVFSSKKSKVTNYLGLVLSWVFRIALASAGLIVAGDAINKVLNRPNSFDNTIQNGKPVETEKPKVVSTSQNKFKVKSSYTDKSLNSNSNWIEKIPNNTSSIENLVLSFANEVYENLEDKTSLIKSLPAFQAVVDKIEWLNHSSPGAPLVFIPKLFDSKKKLVDWFIDDLAEKSA